MSPEEIFKTMQKLIAEQFALNPDEITMDSSFEEDLGADSVDLVELVMAMEEEFELDEIPEEELTSLKTVGDCVEFGGLLGSAPVMPLHRESAAGFIARGGRIPAPLQSLRN